MRCFLVCGGLLIGLFGVVGCGAGGGISGNSYNPGYGPFDANGNYVEAWADKPAKKHWWARKPADTPAAKPTTPPKELPLIAANKPRPTPTRPTYKPTRPTPPKPKPTVVYKPKPKPKPTVVKPKKPAPIRHVVKSGDTLYSLGRRYGTSVTAIQRANGLRGTTIVRGKTLVIPR